MAQIEMITEYALDMLNKDSVSVLKREYAEINGVKTQIGSNWRCAFSNSETGRKEIALLIPEEYVASVFAVWGDTPTVSDDITNQNEE